MNVNAIINSTISAFASTSEQTGVRTQQSGPALVPTIGSLRSLGVASYLRSTACAESRIIRVLVPLATRFLKVRDYRGAARIPLRSNVAIAQFATAALSGTGIATDMVKKQTRRSKRELSQLSLGAGS